MKKSAILVVFGVFILLGQGFILSQQNPEEAKFQKTLDTYLDELWKFYPTSATLAGYYKYNDKLEDLSERNIEKRHDSLEVFNKEFITKIDRSKLSPQTQIDFEMMLDAIDLEFLKHERLLPWDYNPVFYNEIFIHSVRGLLVKEFAPLDARLSSALERLKLLPGLIRQAKQNLKTPPPIFTETAIKQFPAILNFYKTEFPAFYEKGSADLKARIQAETAKLIAALEDYQKFLQNELLPRSTGNPLLGPEVHMRLLRLTCQHSIPFDELAARAKADYNNIRLEMVLVSLPFYRIMYPAMSIEQISAQRGEEEARQIAIKGVLDKIKGEHVAKEEFFNQIKTTADDIKTFITQNQLLDLPSEPLRIEPMPPAFQGITWSQLVSPGPYEQAGNYISEITPIPDTWSKEQVDSFLEEYNNFYLNFWVVRKIFPGPFVPSTTMKKDPSLVRKLYPNKVLIKGWPILVEEMLVTSGYENYDLRLRLNQLKYLLKAVVEFQTELNVHQAGWTKEQAVNYMTRGGFVSQHEAERIWERMLLSPGESIYPYVGYQEILDIQKEYRKLKGEAFSQKEFLQKLLSFGALPIRHLKARVLEAK